MVQCAHHHSQYVYHACAYGLSGHLERPFQHIIPTQAATVLGRNGGRGHDHVENFQVERIISFDSAFVEVGGSFDPCHNRHTSFACSIIEKLNILDVVTADRVVSRMAIYSAKEGERDGEPTFDITGSHFENLKIAGHRVDVKLATHVFHEHDTHSKVAKAHQANKLDDWLLGSKLGKLSDRELGELEETYHALGGMPEVVKGWKVKGDKRRTDNLTFSPLNHINLEEHTGGKTELLGFGSIICIPKFGIVRLAELQIDGHQRILTMFQVDMCSTGTGGTSGGSAGGSGGKPGT